MPSIMHKPVQHTCTVNCGTFLLNWNNIFSVVSNFRGGIIRFGSRE